MESIRFTLAVNESNTEPSKLPFDPGGRRRRRRRRK